MERKEGNRNIFVLIAKERQFLDSYQTPKGYSEEIKRECLTMYVNGMGLRAIGRVKGIHHVAIMNWGWAVGELLPNAYDPETIPQVGELDELETFVGSKKNKFGAAATAASDARRVFELCLCDSSRSLSARNFGLGSWKQ